jgi:transposase
MKPYSQDLRQRVVEAYNNHEGSQREIAQRFGVSLSFVQSILKRYRTSGTVKPRPHGGGQLPKLNPEQMILVAKLVEDNEGLTLAQLCYKLEQSTGIVISRATMGRVIHRLDLSIYRTNGRNNQVLEKRPAIKTKNSRRIRIPRRKSLPAIARLSA